MTPTQASPHDTQRLRLLVLEDSPGDSRLIGELLRSDGLDVSLDVVDTRAGFLQALEEAGVVVACWAGTSAGALVGAMAHDDPEGWDYYKRTVEHADGDPDVHILSNMNNVGAVEVNAFQVHSQALIQKSTKEGFGLTVTEALWKARPITLPDTMEQAACPCRFWPTWATFSTGR